MSVGLTWSRVLFLANLYLHYPKCQDIELFTCIPLLKTVLRWLIRHLRVRHGVLASFYQTLPTFSQHCSAAFQHPSFPFIPHARSTFLAWRLKPLLELFIQTSVLTVRCCRFPRHRSDQNLQHKRKVSGQQGCSLKFKVLGVGQCVRFTNYVVGYFMSSLGRCWLTFLLSAVKCLPFFYSSAVGVFRVTESSRSLCYLVWWTKLIGLLARCTICCRC